MRYLFYGNGSFILWKWQRHDSFISGKTQMRAQNHDSMGSVLERVTNQSQGAALRFITNEDITAWTEEMPSIWKFR